MNRIMRGVLLGVAGVAMATASAQAKPVKYVFMMIGDGMAMPQRNAAALYLANLDGDGLHPGVKPLVMDSLPVQGMATTYSANAVITDSAAAATALATGHKTNSGVINMDPAAKVSYAPLSKLAHDKGYRVGIVSSVSIDHATPAGYYAHVAKRSQYYDIATQLLDSGFEYFAGGAVKEPTGKKKDKPNFYDLAKTKGYTVIQTRAAFADLKPGKKKVFAENPVRADGNALPYAVDAGKDSISLAEFTQKGIDLLKGHKFFMMVEGGKIDWACHANDPAASIGDTVAFDKAVRVVYDFYKKHPDETLIIVTGDHETGGLSIGFAGTKYGNAIKTLEGQKASYVAFDEKYAALRKDKPTVTFDDVLPLIQEAYGIVPADLAPYELEMLKAAFTESLLPKEQRNAKDPQKYLLYGSYDPLSVTLNHLVSHKAGLAWTTYSHTGVPVPVSAVGKDSAAFAGFYDNTDIAKKTMKAMGL